jgi:preprotein translocase subunit YajC
MTLFVLQSGSDPFMLNTIFLLGIVLVFYFFFIRPQSKKQKAQSKFLTDLQKGDEIATASGIIGRINKIEGNIVHLQVDTKTFMKFTLSAISKEMTDSIQKKE